MQHSWTWVHFCWPNPIQSNPIHGWIQSMSNSGLHSVSVGHMSFAMSFSLLTHYHSVEIRLTCRHSPNAIRPTRDTVARLCDKSPVGLSFKAAPNRLRRLYPKFHVTSRHARHVLIAYTWQRTQYWRKYGAHSSAANSSANVLRSSIFTTMVA